MTSKNHSLFAWLAIAAIALSGCQRQPEAAPDDAAKHARSEVERGPIRVTVEVQPVRPRLSDSPTLTLTIDHEEGVVVEPPQFGTMIGRFAIRDVQEPLPKTNEGRVIIQQIYTLEATEPGRLRIDPIAVTFTDRREKGANRPETIETEPLVIEVTSVLGDKTPSLTDLRPSSEPVSLDSHSLAWVWAIAAIALALVAAKMWRRRRIVPQRAPVVKILTPAELAMAELDELAASGLAATDIKEFYIRLTAIVRRYIERTTGIRAPEQTTEEFLREISRTKAFGMDEAARLRDFLESADLVKFAAHRPNSDDAEESIRRARVFIAGEKTQS